MGMGQECQCKSCALMFLSGHSHHEGYSSILCKACVTEFALPTRSAWGPSIGELVLLHKLVREVKVHHKKKPPEITYRLEPTDEFVIAESAGEWGVIYPVSHMVCPNCESKGTMMLDFEDGQSCPKCGDGVMQCCEIEY